MRPACRAGHSLRAAGSDTPGLGRIFPIRRHRLPLSNRPALSDAVPEAVLARTPERSPGTREFGHNNLVRIGRVQMVSAGPVQGTSPLLREPPTETGLFRKYSRFPVAASAY